jgi:hypothetical protein
MWFEAGLLTSIAHFNIHDENGFLNMYMELDSLQ